MVATQTFTRFELQEVQDVDVLVIENDQDYLDIFQALLKSDNFRLEYAKSAQEALKKLRARQFDLILLNAALNVEENGESLLDQIRAISLVPIIGLVEMENEEGSNIVLQGADYDLQKPFTPRRLRAAMTAVLRRSEIGGLESSDPVLPETITSGHFALSLGRLEVTINDQRVSLSAREFSLLQFLMNNPNRTFTREELASQAWGWAKGGELRAIDSAIKRLRSKIEDNTRNPHYVLTERNLGYRFNPDGVSEE